MRGIGFSRSFASLVGRRARRARGPQASCIAQVYVMHVTEDGGVAEQTTRHRSWCHREKLSRSVSTSGC